MERKKRKRGGGERNREEEGEGEEGEGGGEGGEEEEEEGEGERGYTASTKHSKLHSYNSFSNYTIFLVKDSILVWPSCVPNAMCSYREFSATADIAVPLKSCIG